MHADTHGLRRKWAGRVAALLTAGVTLIPSTSQAATAADCITLLNEVSSAVSQIRGWQSTGGVTVAPLGDNSRAIERVTGDLKRARTAYDKAIACAKSDEARKSSGYAKANERFGRDFPKFQTAIVEAGKTYDVFKAAIDADNGMKDLVRRLMKADPAAYDAESKSANDAVAKAAAAASGNPFLTAQWHKGIESAVHGHLTALKGGKATLDKQAARDALIANSVVKKLPGFTPAQAADPRKVAEAFGKMAADALVALPLGNSYVFHRYTPVAKSHPPKSNLAKSYPNDTKPTTPAFVFYNQRTIFVRYVKDELPRMKSPIPGLVWDVVDGKQVVFVSASGGRYVTSIDHVVPVAAAAAPLARGVVNGMLVHDDVVELSRLGVVNARHGTTMAAAKEAYGKCADKVWKANQKKFDKIAEADILRDTRRARRMTLDGKVRKSIDSKCKGPQKKYAKAWNAAMAEYGKQRAAVVQATAGLLPAPKK